MVPRQEVNYSGVVSSSFVGAGACSNLRYLWGSKWLEERRTRSW